MLDSSLMRISNQKNHQRNVFKVHLFFEIMATMAISQRSHGRMNFAYQSLLYLLKILRNYPRIIQTNPNFQDPWPRLHCVDPFHIDVDGFCVTQSAILAVMVF